MKKVAIIGAGITGLSAAYYLENAEIDILEQSDRPGGKIKTYQRDGYTIELGPESYLARKSIMTELATAIGLGDDIVANQTGQSYIYAKNQLHPMPGGSIMGIDRDRAISCDKPTVAAWQGSCRSGLLH